MSPQGETQSWCSLQYLTLTAGRFGPTICGEWSQADTDCTLYLNNVHTGSRWEGTLPTGDPTTAVTSPDCPPDSGTCSCDKANADPSSYSDDYKQWLMMYAEAQMASFEQGWGWFYWTWKTEAATQWSWQVRTTGKTILHTIAVLTYDLQ